MELARELLEHGGPLSVDVDGTPVVVVRTADGVFAYEDRCPHAGWKLSDGELVDGALECPGHGWLFDAASGACTDVPAYCLRPVTVTQQGDTLRLALSDPASGDG